MSFFVSFESTFAPKLVLISEHINGILVSPEPSLLHLVSDLLSLGCPRAEQVGPCLPTGGVVVGSVGACRLAVLADVVERRRGSWGGSRADRGRRCRCRRGRCGRLGLGGDDGAHRASKLAGSLCGGSTDDGSKHLVKVERGRELDTTLAEAATGCFGSNFRLLGCGGRNSVLTPDKTLLFIRIPLPSSGCLLALRK